MSSVKIEADLRILVDPFLEYKFPVENKLTDFCKSLKDWQSFMNTNCPLKKNEKVMYTGMIELESPSMIDNLFNLKIDYSKQPLSLYITLFKDQGPFVLFIIKVNIILKRCIMWLIC